MDHSEIIDQALKAYEIAIRALEERKSAVEAEIADITKLRDRLQRQKYKQPSNGGISSQRPRGEGKSIIIGYLSNNPGATQTQICSSTGIPISSGGRILDRHKDVFRKEGNKWYYIGPDPEEEELDALIDEEEET